MSIRVSRLMQKVRWPKDMVKPVAIRAPGLRLTFTGDESDDLELSLMEAQILMSRVAVKYLDKPYLKEMDVEEVKAGDKIIPSDADADADAKSKQKEN